MSREHHITLGLPRRIARKITPFLSKREFSFEIDRPIVSISFDDFPKSVMENALPQMDAYGWKASFYVAAGLEGITNHLGLHYDAADVKTLIENGHEIACHTHDHVNITEITDSQMDAQTTKNAAALKALGAEELRGFAYPYGETTPARKRYLMPHFSAMRGIMPGVHYGKADLNQIKSISLYSGPDMTRALNYIESLKSKPGWMTLFTHDVRANPSQYGCTPKDFARSLEAIKQSGARVMPVQHAIDFLQNKHRGASQLKGRNV